MTLIPHFRFEEQFGQVHRSSAVFYFRKTPEFSTTISFLNYWKIKRGLEVTVVASLRDMRGNLILRESLDFKSGQVCNYRPIITGAFFQGSLEIEAFCKSNMVVPYAATMALYETPSSLSAVHSYSRNYINQETGISRGEESCWTVRDDSATESFGVFHNGGVIQESQTVKLSIRNAFGERKEVSFPLHPLQPYETVRLATADKFPGLIDFLRGKPGYASLSFAIRDGFSRMLVGHEHKKTGEFQVTHSNFNYSVHDAGTFPSDERGAYMKVPRITGVSMEVIVYPDCAPGSYEVRSGERVVTFRDGDAVTLPCDEDHAFYFQRQGGTFPLRLVTGLRLSKLKKNLPAECSLGVQHHSIPPKRFHWGSCGGNANSSLFIESPDSPAPLTLRLYAPHSNESWEREFPSIEPLRSGLALEELFPMASDALKNDFCAYTLYGESPHLSVYTLWEKDGSVALEHGF